MTVLHQLVWNVFSFTLLGRSVLDGITAVLVPATLLWFVQECFLKQGIHAVM